MLRRMWVGALAASASLVGCSQNPTAPAPLTAVASVVPAGGSTGVNPSAPIVISFTGMMQSGMEVYAALHEGDVTGPVVSGAWTWDASRTTLTFTPATPLKSQMSYTVHLGGGMTDAAGKPLDYSRCVSQFGGQWATSGMMGGNQNMMGPGWRGTNGTYGMLFTFTTSTAPVGSTGVASVSPAGGSTGVDRMAPIVVSFTGMMQAGMEMFAALHVGDVTGPVVPGSWTWDMNRTTMTFTPSTPLKSQTTYTVHLGGGMTDASGQPIDYSRCLSQFGGQWATSTMMGGMMGNQSMMGPGWRAANGTYGLVFTFATA